MKSTRMENLCKVSGEENLIKVGEEKLLFFVVVYRSSREFFTKRLYALKFSGIPFRHYALDAYLPLK